jgi:hypothetical protein
MEVVIVGDVHGDYEFVGVLISLEFEFVLGSQYLEGGLVACKDIISVRLQNPVLC